METINLLKEFSIKCSKLSLHVFPMPCLLASSRPYQHVPTNLPLINAIVPASTALLFPPAIYDYCCPTSTRPFDPLHLPNKSFLVSLPILRLAAVYHASILSDCELIFSLTCRRPHDSCLVSIDLNKVIRRLASNCLGLACLLPSIHQKAPLLTHCADYIDSVLERVKSKIHESDARMVKHASVHSEIQFLVKIQRIFDEKINSHHADSKFLDCLFVFLESVSHSVLDFDTFAANLCSKGSISSNSMHTLVSCLAFPASHLLCKILHILPPAHFELPQNISAVNLKNVPLFLSMEKPQRCTSPSDDVSVCSVRYTLNLLSEPLYMGNRHYIYSIRALAQMKVEWNPLQKKNFFSSKKWTNVWIALDFSTRKYILFAWPLVKSSVLYFGKTITADFKSPCTFDLYRSKVDEINDKKREILRIFTASGDTIFLHLGTRKNLWLFYFLSSQ